MVTGNEICLSRADLEIALRNVHVHSYSRVGINLKYSEDKWPGEQSLGWFQVGKDAKIQKGFAIHPPGSRDLLDGG